MAVQSDATSDVIYEAMRQVLAARAIHNIFRMTESHLMVTSKNLRYCETFNLQCSSSLVKYFGACFPKTNTLFKTARYQY